MPRRTGRASGSPAGRGARCADSVGPGFRRSSSVAEAGPSSGRRASWHEVVPWRGQKGRKNGALGRVVNRRSRQSLTRMVDAKARTPGITVVLKFITCLWAGLIPVRQVTVEPQALAQLTRPKSRVPSLSGLCARSCLSAVIRQQLDTVSIEFFCELMKGRCYRPGQFTERGG